MGTVVARALLVTINITALVAICYGGESLIKGAGFITVGALVWLDLNVLGVNRDGRAE